MAPTRKTTPRIPPSLDVPLLTEVVETESSPSAKPVPAAPGGAAPVPDADALRELLTERIMALADRLLRDASAEMHTALVNRVRETLRQEIPAMVAAAFKENAKK